MSTEKDIILDIKDLKVEFDTYGGVVKAVRGVSYQVRRGKTLAVVGESGCGKSVTVQAMMGLIHVLRVALSVVKPSSMTKTFSIYLKKKLVSIVAVISV